MTNMPFVQLMTELRRGDVEAEASEKLRELCRAVAELGGKGRLTLSIDIQRTEHGHVEVKADVALKVPKRKAKAGIFYLTQDGALSRRDPGQTDIEDIPGVKRPAQTIEGRLGMRAVE